MAVRRTLGLSLLSSGLLCTALAVFAQDEPRGRGRKYKAPPDTSHVEVLVLKDVNKKPIVNAAVIFHPVRDGKDEGNLEIKTDPDGKAIIDVIPTGSKVVMQVIANGYATHAEEFILTENSRAIVVNMLRPQAQISAYQNNRDKESDRPAGVQEPNHPSTPPVVQPPQPTNHTSDPNPLSPISPNAPAPQNPTPK